VSEPPITFAKGRFILERELGRGHAGVVYQARDKVRGESVALKTAPGHSDWIRREFDTLMSLGHPNIVRVHECFYREPTPFFTMELVRGDDLVSHVRREDELTPPPESVRRSTPIAMGEPMREAVDSIYRACSFAGFTRLRSALLQAAEAIDAIHVAGYVHGDLQPSNVLVTYEDRLVVLDFELAAATDERPEFVGNAAYLAPEYGEPGRYGPALDWYALGVIAFEAITGQPPFEGSGPDALARKQAIDSPSPAEVVRRVPKDLADVCVGLLAMRPSARFIARDVFRVLEPT
jgi:serine/threonine protein kinase